MERRGVERRVVLLVSAVVTAALGVALVFVYVRKADDRALAGQTPVRVLVAKTEVAAGTVVSEAIKDGAFDTVRIPRSAAAVGALSSLEAIRNSVALTTLFPGQQVVRPMFGKSAIEAKVNTALPLPTGALAVSFQFNDPARVAGFVEPGSRVGVFVTIDPDATSKKPPFTEVLLPMAQVVAVGPATLGKTPDKDREGGNTEQVPKALLTLALTEKEATKVVFASQKGQLYLGLLNDKSTLTSGTRVEMSSLFS